MSKDLVSSPAGKKRTPEQIAYFCLVWVRLAKTQICDGLLGREFLRVFDLWLKLPDFVEPTELIARETNAVS
jgi:hypothetical protein